MDELFTNRILWTSLTALALAQVLKVFLVALTERKLALDRLLETGGMPSSHSAAVTSLMTSLGLSLGWDSPLFAASVVFGIIVMYDATGIRRAAGMHAQMINELAQELAHVFEDGFQPQVLKTLLGHTYPQVFMGALLGVVTAVVIFL
ncbi:divergent PAP2 family protein [soil metagenome]|jgi:acid phosphatase family membrane protein YuiD|nr:divergent PAP2 family protein [Deinococcota bacterium]